MKETHFFIRKRHLKDWQSITKKHMENLSQPMEDNSSQPTHLPSWQRNMLKMLGDERRATGYHKSQSRRLGMRGSLLRGWLQVVQLLHMMLRMLLLTRSSMSPRSPMRRKVPTMNLSRMMVLMRSLRSPCRRMVITMNLPRKVTTMNLLNVVEEE